MAMKTVYGISFIPEIINNNLIMLKPVHIIDGNLYEDKLVDRYENVYNQITFTTKLENYNKMYGFCIKEEELTNYAVEHGFPESIRESSGICVKAYLSCIKDYLFFLEKKNENVNSYALDLLNKQIIPVDLNKSALNRLTQTVKKNTVIEEKDVQTNSDNTNDNYKRFANPYTLFERITKRVIGQDEAAFELAATICKNMKYSSYENMKGNILLYGPSGCGKTELVRTLAKELQVPLIIEDMTSYTASGYVGDSVKKILRRLINNCGGDVKKAEHGIIVLDEIDKLASTDSRDSVNKTDVQEELLKIIEGGEFDLNEGLRSNKELIINTSNITFILCGAFSEFLETNKKRYIGFGTSQEQLNEEQLQIMTNEDLKDYGLMPELVGRINKMIPIRSLKAKDFEQILTKSSISCLKIYEKALLEEDKVRVVYNDRNKFINAVAIKAECLGTGVRALKTIVDDVFLHAASEISMEFPNERELLISNNTVNNSKIYELKKVKRRDENELSERNGKNNI